MNKILLIGNLTADPEKRATPNGTTVTSFTIVVNRRGAEKQTDFFHISAWRGLAETCAKYLSKGRKVAVIGELQASTYEGKNGVRLNLNVQADEVEFLSPAEQKEKPKTDEWVDISSKDLPWGE